MDCPKCHKEGAYRFRWGGHALNHSDDRWLCKWCGWYTNPITGRTGFCRPCRKMGVWMLEPLDPDITPHERGYSLCHACLGRGWILQRDESHRVCICLSSGGSVYE